MSARNIARKHFIERKNFISKFTDEKLFSDFFNTIADPEIRNTKPVHTLFVKHLDQIQVNFEQNRMVQTIENCGLFHTPKMVNHFDKVLTSCWMTFL